MLGNLITAIGIATSIGMTQPHQPPLKSGVKNYEVSNEYETNYVNSLEDIKKGNIYKYLFDAVRPVNDTFEEDTDYNYIRLITRNNRVLQSEDADYYDAGYNPSITTYEFDYINITKNNNKYILEADDIDDNIYTESLTTAYEVYFYFVVLDNRGILDPQQIVESDYLGNIEVTEITTEGLYNTIENFIETYLYGNDKLKETEYTIMGTTYNMAEWLAHTTTIVLISLIIFVLVIFIKWLFKQIGNTFNLVGVLQ